MCEVQTAAKQHVTKTSQKEKGKTSQRIIVGKILGQTSIFFEVGLRCKAK